MTAGSVPSSLDARPGTAVTLPAPAPHGRPGSRPKPITGRQREMLAFLVRHEDEFGLPSTIREVGAAVGVTSTSVVLYHLRKLEARELIRRQEFLSRGIRVTAKGRDELGIPHPEAAVVTLVQAVREAVAAGAQMPETVLEALAAVA